MAEPTEVKPASESISTESVIDSTSSISQTDVESTAEDAEVIDTNTEENTEKPSSPSQSEEASSSPKDTRSSTSTSTSPSPPTFTPPPHPVESPPAPVSSRTTRPTAGLLQRGVTWMLTSCGDIFVLLMSLVSNATSTSSSFLDNFKKARSLIFHDILRAAFKHVWRRLLRVRWIARTTDALWSRYGINFFDVTTMLCCIMGTIVWFLRWIIGAHRRSLSSSSVMVTSAAGPIGLQCVQELVERSDVGHVFACVAGQDDRSELEVMGSMVQIITLDTKDPKTIDSAFVEVATKTKEMGMTFGGVVVVCASVPLIGPVHHLKSIRLKNQFEVNTVGLVSVVQKFLPLLRSDLRKGAAGNNATESSGRIVCVFGPGSSMPGAFAAAPSATKAATLALMDSLRQELRPTGVDCVSVLPTLDVFTPYLGTRGYSLANALNREIKRKDSLFGVLFERFLNQHQQSSTSEGGNSFVETEMPLLIPTATATLSALVAYPAPCSIMVSGWSTQWWDRRIRCRSKREQHLLAMQSTMRPVASDYMQEYGWWQWIKSGVYGLVWWCVVLLVGSFLLV